MITSIKHPLVFVALIASDVTENVFCLWSLSRTTSPINVVAPSVIVQDSGVRSIKKSFMKRSSSVLTLTRDMREEKDESSEGTALFIAAILLQREMVEAIVPMQVALVLSVLYFSDIKSNSLVSDWKSNEDYLQAMTYLGIDLGVELVVFLFSILTLKRIYPNFSAIRIVLGLVRSNGLAMFAFTILIWVSFLIYQNTLSGMDLSLRFEWLDCDGENATWVGGYHWENCS
jgi:hypothetical protein